MNLNPYNVPCRRCGQSATGWAFINGERYCHDGESPTCYEAASTDMAGSDPATQPYAGLLYSAFEALPPKR